MSENDLIIVEHLHRLRRDIELGRKLPDTMGICGRISASLLTEIGEVQRHWFRTREWAMARWELFSNDPGFPVWDATAGGSPMQQYYNRDLWSGRQRELRLDLVKHLINHYGASAHE
jgi:hypothetical protein